MKSFYVVGLVTCAAGVVTAGRQDVAEGLTVLGFSFLMVLIGRLADDAVARRVNHCAFCEAQGEAIGEAQSPSEKSRNE